MDIFKKLACFALILAVLLCTPHVLRSFGLTAKDVVNALFSEKPREDAVPIPVPEKKAPAPAVDSNRGHARENRPDISVPPPASASAVEYSPEDEKKFNEMISGLEHVALNAPNAP